MTDLASFNKQHILAVFGEHPLGYFTHRHKDIDPMHIMGRGGKHERKVHSSIYNLAFGEREFHASGVRDHPFIRTFLLEKTKEKVDYAISQGRYQRTENDTAFLKMYDSYYSLPYPK